MNLTDIGAPELQKTAISLRKYDPTSAVSRLSGLLTIPELQANSNRIETLIHLAVANCSGRRPLNKSEISQLLNQQLRDTSAALYEDPPSDVFMTNIESPEGNLLLFQGIWESSDYYLQMVIDLMNNAAAHQEPQSILKKAMGLLTLSDTIAKRTGLGKWHCCPSTPRCSIQMPLAKVLKRQARAVHFTVKDLEDLCLDQQILGAFILEDSGRDTLNQAVVGNSLLERQPLVKTEDGIILALPNAVSVAIRMYILSAMHNTGCFDMFCNAIARYQSSQILRKCLQSAEIEIDSVSQKLQKEKSRECESWLFKYDIDKYLHVVYIPDYCKTMPDTGVSGMFNISEKQLNTLRNHVAIVASHCRGLTNFSEGTTIIVLGGVGRGSAGPIVEWPDEWRSSFLKIAEFLWFNRSGEYTLIDYLRFLSHREWAEKQGYAFMDQQGDFSLYCYWRQNGQSITVGDIGIDDKVLMWTGEEFMQSVRKTVRIAEDRHVAQKVNGAFVGVTRLNKDAYFPSMSREPIYIERDIRDVREISGVIETDRGSTWLAISEGGVPEFFDVGWSDVWQGFMELLNRLVNELEGALDALVDGAIELHLDFQDVVNPQNISRHEIVEASITVHDNNRIAELRFPDNWLSHFRQVDNRGERAVVRSMARALFMLHHGKENSIGDTVLEELVVRVLGNSDKRIIHAFERGNLLDQLQMRHSKRGARINSSCWSFSRYHLAKGCRKAVDGTVLQSKKECARFLHCVVGKICERIISKLSLLDRRDVIMKCYNTYEACLTDQKRWTYTARALLALYGQTDDVYDVSSRNTAELGNVMHASRTLIEMAVCECPISDGRLMSRWDLEDLLAEVILLVDVAYESDAIHNDLASPMIEIYPNGEYLLQDRKYVVAIRKFVSAYRKVNFDSAAERYGDLYYMEEEEPDESREHEFSDAFVSAFKAEYDITPSDIRLCYARMLELCLELNCLVVETSSVALRERMVRSEGVTPSIADAFIRSFGLSHRPKWDIVPNGVKRRHIYPWRFRRRLALSARPIVVLGDGQDSQVVFGVGGLYLACRNMVTDSEEGRLPQDFFRSNEMKKYVGDVNNERGHGFARSVGMALDNSGWNTLNEVRMSSLGAPAEFGDIDILAWKSDGSILIIECKRLQFARSVAEVAEVCRRFEGKVKDQLGKHIRRVKWIKSNVDCLKNTVGFVPERDNIDVRVVTNTHVPMKYLEALPIDTSKIGPLEVE